MTAVRPTPDPPVATDRGGARRVLVVTSGDPTRIGDALARLARVALGHDVELVLDREERRKHPAGSVPQEFGDDAAGADLLLALGGDGTTLRALRRVVGTDVPVLAVNFGHVGFLTTAEARDLESAASCAFRGAFEIVELPSLAVERDGRPLGLALNDVVVTGAEHARIARMCWAVQGDVLHDVSCDSLIVSTPSGSTGYGLSAGGPILAWNLDAVCVSIAASYSLTVRPVVLPGATVLTVTSRDGRVDLQVTLDGQPPVTRLRRGEEVVIRPGSARSRLALLSGHAPGQRIDAVLRRQGL